MSGAPHPKEQQLARGARRYRRKVASPKKWAAIIDAKRGPCRVCGRVEKHVEYHHVAPRAIGGSDVEENIVPLCADCHRLVTERDKETCARLRLNLTDAEYAFGVETLGEARFEDRYPVTWEKP